MNIMCISDCNFFTVGKVYYCYDGSSATGVYTTDDDGGNHYLSPDFLCGHFKEV